MISHILIRVIIGGKLVKDFSRRIIISLTLAVIIMGGMSVSLANMPTTSNTNDEIVQVQGK
ncbi:protein YkpC [Metabacillus malikii]|uniref:protein YkpC n=1 Tax=Metabacillus malikii TaxID=1504265 RepID=UPI0027D7ECB4|nr:protein YkpC [Metabacillus malikii]